MKEKGHVLMRPIVITATLIGVIQSIVWFGLSVIAILKYYNVVDLKHSDVNDATLRYFLWLFLEQDQGQILKEDKDNIVSPQLFSIFMSVYVGASFMWFAISSALMYSANRNKWENAFALITFWASTTLIVSVLDATLMSLITHDYHNIIYNKAIFEPAVVDAYIIMVCYGIMVCLSARGFALWVINVASAIILLRLAFIYRKETDGSIHTEFINAYDTSRAPLEDLHLYEESRRDSPLAFSNKGYVDNEEGLNSEYRSRSFVNLTAAENDAHTYLNPLSAMNKKVQSPVENKELVLLPNALTNTNGFVPQEAKYAKIGKPSLGRSTPPLNVPPPFIPEPDYTPPGSLRKYKSVLKTESNYN